MNVEKVAKELAHYVTMWPPSKDEAERKILEVLRERRAMPPEVREAVDLIDYFHKGDRCGSCALCSAIAKLEAAFGEEGK